VRDLLADLQQERLRELDAGPSATPSISSRKWGAASPIIGPKARAQRRAVSGARFERWAPWV